MSNLKYYKLSIDSDSESDFSEYSEISENSNNTNRFYSMNNNEYDSDYADNEFNDVVNGFNTFYGDINENYYNNLEDDLYNDLLSINEYYEFIIKKKYNNYKLKDLITESNNNNNDDDDNDDDSYDSIKSILISDNEGSISISLVSAHIDKNEIIENNLNIEDFKKNENFKGGEYKDISYSYNIKKLIKFIGK
jgi:hypothetical protein